MDVPDSTPSPLNTSGGVKRIVISDLTNREFLERFAAPGRVGLSGGLTWIDNLIVRAEQRLDPEAPPCQWSHAFVFQGPRLDGQQWVVESDLQFHRKHIRMGAQENRISKYCDSKLYSTLAILDFGLTEAQVSRLLTEALDLVASHARYSIRELVGTLIALRKPELRAEENVLARERSMYCSAFVQHLFRKIDLDLSPGVHAKNTTPEDIWRAIHPHTAYVWQPALARTRLERARVRLHRRLKARVKSFKKQRKKSD